MAARAGSAVPVHCKLSPDCNSDCTTNWASFGVTRISLGTDGSIPNKEILGGGRGHAYRRLGTPGRIVQRRNWTEGQVRTGPSFWSLNRVCWGDGFGGGAWFLGPNRVWWREWIRWGGRVEIERLWLVRQADWRWIRRRL